MLSIDPTVYKAYLLRLMKLGVRLDPTLTQTLINLCDAEELPQLISHI